MKTFFEEGLDMMIIILLIPLLSKISSLIFGVLLVYCIIRSCFVKNIVPALMINILILLTALITSINSNIHGENEVVFLIVTTTVLLIIATIQIFVILIRIFNFGKKVEHVNQYIGWKGSVIKILSVFKDMLYTLRIIIGIIYPILLTCIILLSFAGMYNGINYFYKDSKHEIGLYSNNGIRIETTNIDGLSNIGGNLRRLNRNGYLYFSATTHFTIGYGDISPKGELFRFVTIIHMILSHMLNISLFAVFGALFYDFIKSKEIESFIY
ncbi:ion channel [Sporosalibacterium faouarense]|uniref:ion channel n=1 Tax=Sporosalibacterium faouarense TaxID=516123 RepID=UPI00192CA3BD|nr:ion channel [Sporosalibacterium faouarense]